MNNSPNYEIKDIGSKGCALIMDDNPIFENAPEISSASIPSFIEDAPEISTATTHSFIEDAPEISQASSMLSCSEWGQPSTSTATDMLQRIEHSSSSENGILQIENIRISDSTNNGQGGRKVSSLRSLLTNGFQGGQQETVSSSAKIQEVDVSPTSTLNTLNEMVTRKTKKRSLEYCMGICHEKKNKPMDGSQFLKSAVNCLYELCPEAHFTLKQEGDEYVAVSVELKNMIFMGYGSSEMLAKEAAAEAALVSFVQDYAEDEEMKCASDTPWNTLVSFALYKLVSQWENGDIASFSPTVVHPISAGYAVIPTNLQEQQLVPITYKMKEILDAHLSAFKLQKKCFRRNIPGNAASIHPASLLAQMRPGLVYTKEVTMTDNGLLYNISCIIDGCNYRSQGKSAKVAKLELATYLVEKVYGITSTYGTSK